ncbi:hypothetical protein V8J82_10105 [Gymnodinialimonas sp. 2305UL16-5]|uniref:hypothetical protein n=1 Tax=Gymnodinialimonas mytili TaxID=3126503 RepID=UPI0030A23588
MTSIRLATLLGPALIAPSLLLADPAEVLDVEATSAGDTWRFSVTIAHADAGWDDYADGWRIEGADGTIYGERPLAHPHVDEQPFTRSVSGVAIPDGVTEVMIRASTNIEGYAEDTFGPFPLSDDG